MRYLLLILGLIIFTPTTSKAQWLDPDRCWTCKDSQQHFLAGAGLDLGLQILPNSWQVSNKPWKRVALVALVGAVYEAGQADVAHSQGLLGNPGYGFGLKDEACNIGGAVVSELLTWGLRKVL